jgi:hypothetical protein
VLFFGLLVSQKSEVVVGFGVFPASITICSLIWVGSQFGFLCIVWVALKICLPVFGVR